MYFKIIGLLVLFTIATCSDKKAEKAAEANAEATTQAVEQTEGTTTKKSDRGDAVVEQPNTSKDTEEATTQNTVAKTNRDCIALKKVAADVMRTTVGESYVLNTIQYNNGCLDLSLEMAATGSTNYSLYWDGIMKKSFPPQVVLKLVPQTAYPVLGKKTENVSFDLSILSKIGSKVVVSLDKAPEKKIVIDL